MFGLSKQEFVESSVFGFSLAGQSILAYELAARNSDLASNLLAKYIPESFASYLAPTLIAASVLYGYSLLATTIFTAIDKRDLKSVKSGMYYILGYDDVRDECIFTGKFKDLSMLAGIFAAPGVAAGQMFARFA